MKSKEKICIIGLGYVGLPLAYEFSKNFEVIGFDLNTQKISNLKNNIDITGEIEPKNLRKLNKIFFTHNITSCRNCNVFIVTVPTPILQNKKPDLSFLKKASVLISKILKKNDLIIFESTTFPGCTEEICIPIIEKNSKLVLNKDFLCGYSPERVNPSDKKHKIYNINKIVSGSNAKALSRVFSLYNKIIKAKIIKTSSIKVAEAAKVIENTQRDINIAFINELMLIFNKLNLDTNEILKAASSKWNFLKFEPGFVGGHCIGVDPYYLEYKAKQSGIKPNIISAGRIINDSIPNVVLKKIYTLLKKNKNFKKNLNILILGITFKENCNDFRNSKVFDIIRLFKKKGAKVDTIDPVVNEKLLYKNHKVKLIKNIKKNNYDVILSAVKHNYFLKKDKKYFIKLLNQKGFIYDFKNIFDEHKQIYKP